VGSAVGELDRFIDVLYKPIRFGDGPDPDMVEGHRNKVVEAAETRANNRRMKELEAEDKYRRESLLEKIFGFFFSKQRI
jgi:hypothetical protein